jgi:hypothetical protein
MGDMYDVNKYSDEELYNILDINNPTDRELEAKILSMVNKYSLFGNASGNKLMQFFIDIYNRFFEDYDDEEDEEESNTLYEGFDTATPAAAPALAVAPAPASGPGPIQLSKQIDYPKDKLNPILKETVRRIISIDSQYRENKSITTTTNFTFNLSEPLRDVVSLKLYSVQIPYTWYTIDYVYGNTCFWVTNNGN